MSNGRDVLRGVGAGLGSVAGLMEQQDQLQAAKAERESKQRLNLLLQVFPMMEPSEAMAYGQKIGATELEMDKMQPFIGRGLGQEDPQQKLHNFMTSTHHRTSGGEVISVTPEMKEQQLAMSPLTDEGKRRAGKAYGIDSAIAKPKLTEPQKRALNREYTQAKPDGRILLEQQYPEHTFILLKDKPRGGGGAAKNKENFRQKATVEKKRKNNTTERNRLLRAVGVVDVGELNLDDPVEKKAFDKIQGMDEQNSTLDSMSVELGADPKFHFTPAEFKKLTLGKKKTKTKETKQGKDGKMYEKRNGSWYPVGE